MMTRKEKEKVKKEAKAYAAKVMEKAADRFRIISEGKANNLKTK